MAKFGAKYLRFAPFATTNPEPNNALPNYGAPLDVGSLVKVADSPAFNEGKIYGDNVLGEYVNEFKECGIDVEVTELANIVAATVLGATLTATPNAELRFSTNDNAPYGGFGCIVCKIIDNVKKFQGVFYPKVKAAMQGDEYTTKGDGVTLTGGKLKFTATAAKNGQWKIMSEDLADEATAQAWVDAMLGGTGYHTINVSTNGATTGESVTPMGLNYVANAGAFELTIVGTVTALYDNGTESKTSIVAGKYKITNVTAAHDIVVVF